jgi:hypothetical protein
LADEFAIDETYVVEIEWGVIGRQSKTKAVVVIAAKPQEPRSGGFGCLRSPTFQPAASKDAFNSQYPWASVVYTEG